MNYIYVYLIFSKTGTWLSRALNIFSDTKYVHASISFDDSFSKMYSFGRTNPSNPFSGGFVEENLFDGVYKNNPLSECIIYKVKITDKQYDCLLKEVQLFQSEKDKYRYNFLGLFGVLVNRPLKRKDHYFCTQFVSEILIKSEIYYTQKMPELIKPSDLFLVHNKELIYEGLITNHPLTQCS
ncbi:hypothetical protein JK636_14020 [Clostridium sp. YIM B02515]|uniref:Uncharacterized protein n=1 Tax=Clostridium rhizosphaerae TaxID=2803861 RepID=A0ABS1TBX5_9CLOT|nr:hypothetical protein [Clostridium rhizosphaerae]MBL4936872.1 hypothetical protein [Clostridium rhizosphaerae]